MSRWIDDFEQHTFQNDWKSLKDEVNQATVDDKTILTSVDELARLRKVIAYIDEIISGLDPELVPVSTWANVSSQVTPCLQQVMNYKSNRNVGHIVNANSHADNLLSYVRPYMIAAGKVNKTLQEAIKNYAKTYSEVGAQIKTEVITLASEIQEIADKNKERDEFIEKTQKSIKELSERLFASVNPEGSIETEAEEILEDLNDKAKKIDQYYNETLVGTAEKPPIKKVILDIKDTINEDKENIEDLLEEVKENVQKLQDFYDKVYGKSVSSGKAKDGLANYIEQKKNDLDSFEEKQKKKYETLNAQIESLLPGATSAGLASAYYELKESFNNPIAKFSKLFYISLGALFFVAFISSIEKIGWFYISFVDVSDWNVLLKLVYKVPLYAPILWLALYASRRRSESQRLQQEYAHKEALAKSYDNYKKQIEQLDDKDLEMQKAFIMKAIDAIAYNASSTLDKNHGDKIPAQELLEKILDKTESIAKIGK